MREGLQRKAPRRGGDLERKARQPAASASALAGARTTGGTPRQGTGNRNREQEQGRLKTNPASVAFVGRFVRTNARVSLFASYRMFQTKCIGVCELARNRAPHVA